MLCIECDEETGPLDEADPYCLDCHTCECGERYQVTVGGLTWNATWNTPGLLVCPVCDSRE